MATNPTIKVDYVDRFQHQGNEVNSTNGQQQQQQQQSSKSSETTITTTKIHTTTITENSALSSDSTNTVPLATDAVSIAVVEDLGKQAAVESSAGIRRNMSRQSEHSSPNMKQYPNKEQSNSSANELNSNQDDHSSKPSIVRDETVDGNKVVTTISTIAAQSGQSRIVLALLKDGHSLQLKIQEMRPGIFEVGANYKECLKYFEEHQKLMRNLRKQKQTPIDCWLSKYDKISASEPNMSTERKLVYLCMVENLHGCWKALLNQLDKRSHLLDETCKFYESTEQLMEAIDRADNHVQIFRQEFLNGSTNSIRFNQACNEFKALNQIISDKYNDARNNQQKLVDLISIIGTGNLGDARVNQLISDAQNLINYINTYIDPLERRKTQLESVITITKSTTVNENYNKQYDRFIEDQKSYNDHNEHSTFISTKKRSIIREINDFNDLSLVENWLQLKIEQLNSSLLSSLGATVPDSRSILGKHEQIALECRAIEEATLTFNGKNIHALKSIDPNDDKRQDDKSLFEQQKLLATRARDVITILDARIVLLRRTIDFYLRSKDATGDITKMMRRLQVENSLQSVQFVSNELELKDVSSVVASGATVISELQQLQLAQQHGQRSSIVNLNLVTNGIRSIIDQLNQDLAHLKTVLSQRKLVLLNEDATKMANNFSNKCHQLHFWLNNHVKSFLMANNRLSTELAQVRIFCENHEQLRILVQNKTLEVEALLRSLSTLTENFDAKSKIADDIQRATDELKQDWINVTNCLDGRIELARKYMAIMKTVTILSKELDSLESFNKGTQTTLERTDEDIQSNIDQSFVQLSNQVKNFKLDGQKNNTELVYLPGLDKKQVINDINKQQLIDHVNGLLEKFANQKQETTWSLNNKKIVITTNNDPAHQRPQQVDPPRFTRVIRDQMVEPFSTVELECETDEANCQIEWFMNNFKKIPSTIKHLASSENNQHKLTINHFSPICCGTYIVKASNNAGQAISQCRLRLLGIKEINNDKLEETDRQPVYSSTSSRQQNETVSQIFQSSSPAISTTSSFSQWRPFVNGQTETPTPTKGNNKNISSIIRGVESCERDSLNKQQTTQITQLANECDTDTTTTTTTTTTTIDKNSKPQLPITQTTYSGPVKTSSININDNNHLRVNYIDSPMSSATLSRSVSKSPFDGTPQPPVFMQGLTDTMPHCCSRAGLVCLVVGNPPPTIEWLHNNTTIAITKCPKTKSNYPRGNICKLTIETMNNRTRGQYVCRASNRVGQTSTGLSVTK